ncbi:50S ribosomal protein L16 3-hydroxylase [Halothiobacillus neapolitanus]|nr:50S ribosomal protein L16 3-hydroxylase [Halothiobacillus neapolitanus]
MVQWKWAVVTQVVLWLTRFIEVSFMVISQVLGTLSVADFLRDYWQKKPVLIRQGVPGFESPLSPEELAGLACEEDVPARLILESAGARPWTLRHGPFTEADFTSLPEDGYSLLITDCEKLIPDLMNLVQHFRFVPDWRIDDLMISYAPPGGSVGAHIDEYDVFLLQGMGRRKWMIEYPPKHSDFVPDLDIRLLQEFEPTEEWVLEPGDMLYLPPGVPHHGVAVDHCMTYSIGFRAPLLHEMAAGVTDRLITDMDQAARYGDPDLQAPANPGALDASSRVKLRAILQSVLDQDDAVLDRFIAETLTERPLDHAGFYPQNDPLDAKALRGEIAHSGDTLMRTPAARLLLVEDEPDSAGGALAVDGQSTLLNAEMLPLARLLVSQVFYDAAELLAATESEAAAELLQKLYADGVVQWQPNLLSV